MSGWCKFEIQHGFIISIQGSVIDSLAWLMPRSLLVLGGSIIVLGSLLSKVVLSQNSAEIAEDVILEYNENELPAHEEYQSSTPPCCSTPTVEDAHYLLLSTMDGKLIALDALNGGKVAWETSFVEQPLMSGTLGRLQPMQADGRLFNLVPSLDGSLYMYSRDERLLEPIPLNTEMLLQASVRIGHDAVAGGKTVTTSGLDPLTGKVRYHCSAAECNTLEKGVVSSTLVFRRNTHSVRAVDALTGSERWNLSVSEYDASLVLEDSTAQIPSPSRHGIRFLLQPPDGVVTAFDSCGNELWTHVVDSHIAKAWRMESSQLSEVSLFDAENIHTLAMSDVDDTPKFIKREDSLFYLGTLKDEPFIMHSRSVKNELKRIARQTMDIGDMSTSPGAQMIQTANSLFFVQDQTLDDLLSFSYRQSFSAKQQYAVNDQQLVQRGSRELQVVNRDRKKGIGSCPSSDTVALIGEQNIKSAAFDSSGNRDQGWFVLKPPGSGRNANLLEASKSQCAANLLCNIDEKLNKFWKVSVGMLVTVLLTGLTTVAFLRSRRVPELPSSTVRLRTVSLKKSRSTSCGPSVRGESSKSSVSVNVTRLSRERRTTSSNDSTCEPFHSKFQLDFEPVKLIGHGGFGVVFKAMNRLDEAFYAVKRIAVANSDRAIQRVLREVRAMAKLEHPGIIRYYHTWIEKPPPGWQEDIDRTLLRTIRNKRDEEEEFILCQPNKVSVSNGKLESASGDSLSTSEIEAPSMREQESEGSWLEDSRPEVPESYSDSSSGDDSCLKQDKTSKDGSSLSHIVFEKGDNSDAANSSGNAQKLGTEMVLVTSIDEEAELFPSSTATSFVYLYIQMQLCQERTLHSWLTEYNRPEDRASDKMKSWLTQLCGALSYIHEQGLIHRDVKPQNIFFSSDNNLKIGDLGLVTKCVSAEVQPIEIERHSKNGVNHTDNVGTRSYMSPEQLQNKPYTYKVDVFSLGLIFCELIIPFQTLMERSTTLGALQKGEVPKVVMDLTEKDRKMVLWLTSLDPELRPSCSDILEHSYFRIDS